MLIGEEIKTNTSPDADRQIIDYRAWDQEQKIMLYHVQNAYDWLSCGVEDSQGEEAEYEEDCFGSFIDNPRYIVQQATGVCDVKHHMIYERDYVVLNTNIIFIVKYGKVNTKSGFVPGFHLASTEDGTICQFLEQIRIVGNQYEGIKS